MRLINRQTFLKMPEGTVYCKFPLNDNGNAERVIFGMSAPSIKGCTIADQDFCCCTLGESLQPETANDSEELFNTLFDMQKNLNKEVRFELVTERDGMFDDDNVGFMILSKEEVQEMIDELQNCLKKAY